MANHTQPLPFAGIDAPRDEDLSRCVHCGLCLMSCPTFVTTGLEPESPRGRIYLIKAVSEGRIELNDAVLPHLEQCLQCRNCESVCPSGVPYGRIMESARAQIFEQRIGPAAPRRLRTLILRGLLPHKRRIAVLAHLLRWQQRAGLLTLPRRLPIWRRLPSAVRDLLTLTPTVSERFYRAPTEPKQQVGEPVAFFSGCVMPYMYAETQAATERVLTRLGCAVQPVPAQGCCGALLLHSGDREAARELARRNIDAFLADEPSAIVVNAAGCGSTLKEYGELLEHDPAYAERARRFASLVRDVTEFVVSRPFADGLGAVHARVTYQDSCHLAHAQRIKQPPRRIIRSIPGVRFVDMPNADRCCGSAGIYNIVQHDLSMQILDAKMEEVGEAAPDIIVTANPGCMLQLQAGLDRRGLRARVLHVVELLDLAQRAGRSTSA